MLALYAARTTKQGKVYERVERFKAGRTSVADESRSGGPSTLDGRTHPDGGYLDQGRATNDITTNDRNCGHQL